MASQKLLNEFWLIVLLLSGYCANDSSCSGRLWTEQWAKTRVKTVKERQLNLTFSQLVTKTILLYCVFIAKSGILKTTIFPCEQVCSRGGVGEEVLRCGWLPPSCAPLQCRHLNLIIIGLMTAWAVFTEEIWKDITWHAGFFGCLTKYHKMTAISSWKHVILSLWLNACKWKW